MTGEREAGVWRLGGDGPWSRAAGVVAGTCGWACAILLVPVLAAAVVGLVAGAVAAAQDGGGLYWAASAASIGLMMWFVAVAVVWVLGLPAGLVVERVLDGRGAAPPWRAAALAALGGALALVASVAVGLWTWPGLTAALVVAGVVAAGGGRLAVARRARRVSEGRAMLRG